jgi:hypothetical protein
MLNTLKDISLNFIIYLVCKIRACFQGSLFNLPEVRLRVSNEEVIATIRM